MDVVRRRLLVGVPAVLAGLQVAGATAHADDDDRGHGRGRGRRGEGEDDDDDDRNQAVRRKNATFSADLVPANTITADFSGVGDTGSGSLAVFSSAGAANSINVTLRGASANTTYTLVFEAVGGSRTGALGSFTTNSAGNANASFSNVLPQAGSATSSGLGTRVGVFVLTRSAGDAFVTAA